MSMARLNKVKMERAQSEDIGDRTVLLATRNRTASAASTSLAKAKIAATLSDEAQIRRWEATCEGISSSYKLPKLLNSDIWTSWYSTFQLVVTLTDSDYLFDDDEVPTEVAICQYHASRVSWFRRFIFASITHIPVSSIPTEPDLTVDWLMTRYQPYPGIEAMRTWSDIADLTLSASDRPINDLQNTLSLLKERAKSAELDISNDIWKLVTLRAVREAFPELTRDWLTTKWDTDLWTLLPELVASEASSGLDSRNKRKKKWSNNNSNNGQATTRSPAINSVRPSSVPGSVSADSLEWLLDSGAWFHISNSAVIFSQLDSCGYDLCAANGSPLQVKGKGTIKMVCSEISHLVPYMNTTTFC